VHWRKQWSILSKRIDGVLEAGRLHFSFVPRDSPDHDPFVIVRTVLLPNSQETFNSIVSFQDQYGSSLPSQAAGIIQEFISKSKSRFGNSGEQQAAPGLALQWRLVALASFQAEFTYHLSDFEAVAH
jgi:hypothetical protein